MLDDPLPQEIENASEQNSHVVGDGGPSVMRGRAGR
jgi:hypothetical protein